MLTVPLLNCAVYLYRLKCIILIGVLMFLQKMKCNYFLGLPFGHIGNGNNVTGKEAASLATFNNIDRCSK